MYTVATVTKINLRGTSHCNSYVNSILELRLFLSVNNSADFIKKI